jgi:hypothetical protein
MLVGLPLELWVSVVSENGGLLRRLLLFSTLSTYIVYVSFSNSSHHSRNLFFMRSYHVHEAAENNQNGKERMEI